MACRKEDTGNEQAGFTLLRRSARRMEADHPLEGSVFVSSILNSLTHDQYYEIVKCSGFILKNNEDDISEFKDKEAERVLPLK